MLREKKGVTLVVLIVAVIVMLIIFGVTITAGTDLLRNSDKNRLKTNLYLIKARAETLLEDYLFDGTDNLGDVTSEDKINMVGFLEEGEDIIYREWNISKLKEEGIDTKDVSSTESFIIQYNKKTDKVDVASTKGYKDEDGNITYILSRLDD